MAIFPKRDKFVFVSNLKNVTCDPRHPETMIRDAYLLSAHYSNRKLESLAGIAAAQRNLIVSDNGNFSQMTAIAKEYRPQAKKLDQMLKDGAPSHKISPIQTKLSQAIAVTARKTLAAQKREKTLQKQLRIKPDFLIGFEDLTIPAMQMSGLFQEGINSTRSEILPFQRTTRHLFKNQLRGEWGKIPDNCLPHMVLHGFDYSSMHQAGSLIRKPYKRTPIDAIAVSLGASMRSNQWITEIRLGRRKMKFGEKLPEKYLLSQALLLGAITGVRRKTRLHILGLGSPILIALSAILLPRTNGISIDSTSPFMDADDGTIYGSRQAYLKMNMYKVAAWSLVRNEAYYSQQPFFEGFERKYPSRWKELARILDVSESTNINALAKYLKGRQDLVREYIPYFTKIRSHREPFFVDLRRARAGSNLYVIKEICDAVRRRAKNPDNLKLWVDRETDKYNAVAHPKWARAVQKTVEMSKLL